MIRRAHPALRETTETLADPAPPEPIIRDFIEDADASRRGRAGQGGRRAAGRDEASDTAAIQASRREQLGRYWNRLPEFLAELEPTMAELERTAERQMPTLRKLGGAAPELERFLRSAVPFARESRESIDDSAAPPTPAARPCARRARRSPSWRAGGRGAAPGKPLRQFLQTIDDRRRSTENDPAGRAAAPPAPDKTAYGQGQGFTGMEAFWNYIYWQTLGINAFDDFGHLLRIVASPWARARRYAAKPTKARSTSAAPGSARTSRACTASPTRPRRPRPPRSSARRTARRPPPRHDGGHRGAGEPRATEPPPGPARHLPAADRDSRGRPGAARPARRQSRPGADLPAPATARRERFPPTSSTSCSGHETPPRQPRSSRARCWSGAVTVLVPASSVMLAVQANSGLPFVPTYNVKAEIPGGANLVVGNEVRIGGFRVGVVDRSARP